MKIWYQVLISLKEHLVLCMKTNLEDQLWWSKKLEQESSRLEVINLKLNRKAILKFHKPASQRIRDNFQQTYVDLKGKVTAQSPPNP